MYVFLWETSFFFFPEVSINSLNWVNEKKSAKTILRKKIKGKMSYNYVIVWLAVGFVTHVAIVCCCCFVVLYTLRNKFGFILLPSLACNLLCWLNCFWSAAILSHPGIMGVDNFNWLGWFSSLSLVCRNFLLLTAKGVLYITCLFTWPSVLHFLTLLSVVYKFAYFCQSHQL